MKKKLMFAVAGYAIGSFLNKEEAIVDKIKPSKKNVIGALLGVGVTYVL